MAYNINSIVENCIRNGYRIAPQNRMDWVRFAWALIVLNFDAFSFVALSDENTENEARTVWRREKDRASRYMTPDQAAGTIVAIAKDFAEMNAKDFKAIAGSSTTDWHAPAAAAPQPKQPPIYISADEVARAAAHVKRTVLYNFLCSKFPMQRVDEVLAAYRVGASGRFQTDAGLSVAFPFISIDGKVVDVHIMQYNPNGHRGNYQHWAQSIRKQNDRRADWVLFGEHLAAEHPDKPIAIVESEKTALIASMIFRQIVWCATQSKTNLNGKRLQNIKHREIFVFPDVDGIEDWETKCGILRAEGYNISLCSDIISDNAATEKDDLADIILNNLHYENTNFMQTMQTLGEKR